MSKPQLAVVPSAKAKGRPERTRLPKDKLDWMDDHSHIEAVVVQQLQRILCPVTENLIGACMEMRVLPHRLLDGLDRLRFLSLYVFAAHYAEAVVGVPSSILLADAWYSTPSFYLPPKNKDVFKMGKGYRTLKAAFVDRASYLACCRKFHRVLDAIDTPEQYLSEIRRCQIWSAEGAASRADMIENDGLQACDFPQRNGFSGLSSRSIEAGFTRAMDGPSSVFR